METFDIMHIVSLFIYRFLLWNNFFEFILVNMKNNFYKILHRFFVFYFTVDHIFRLECVYNCHDKNLVISRPGQSQGAAQKTML